MRTSGREIALNSRDAFFRLNRRNQAEERNNPLHKAEADFRWLWGSDLQEGEISSKRWMIIGDNFWTG